VLDPFGPRLDGEQLKEEGEDKGAPPITMPPEDTTTIPLPDADDPEPFVIPI
jgi:hypothetical protein